jgi:hypothetical protein
VKFVTFVFILNCYQESTQYLIGGQIEIENVLLFLLMLYGLIRNIRDITLIYNLFSRLVMRNLITQAHIPVLKIDQ